MRRRREGGLLEGEARSARSIAASPSARRCGAMKGTTEVESLCEEDDALCRGDSDRGGGSCSQFSPGFVAWFGQ